MISVCTSHRPHSVAIIKNKHDEISSMYPESSCKVSHFLLHIIQNLNVSTNFNKGSNYEISWKSVWWDTPFHKDVWVNDCLPELLGDMVMCFEHNGVPGLFIRYTTQFSNNGLKVTSKSCKTGQRGHQVWYLWIITWGTYEKCWLK